MRNIFIGYLPIFLDFNLTLSSCIVGLIPDFVGYIFLVKGLEELKKESSYYVKIRPAAIGMGIYTGVIYAMDLCGISVNLGWPGWWLSMINTAVSLFITYEIIQGIKALEKHYGSDFNSIRLQSAWTLTAVFRGLAYVLSSFPAVAMVCIVLSIVCTILLLVALHRTSLLYEALPADSIPKRAESPAPCWKTGE